MRTTLSPHSDAWIGTSTPACRNPERLAGRALGFRSKSDVSRPGTASADLIPAMQSTVTGRFHLRLKTQRLGIELVMRSTELAVGNHKIPFRGHVRYVTRRID